MQKNNLRNAPAYQEYASDILADRDFRLMGLAERGLLWTMRLECWVNKSLPSEKEGIAKILNLNPNEVTSSCSPKVLKHFSLLDESLFCTELDAYREKLQEKNRRISEGGRTGGLATQKASRQIKATLEGSLKPLSRDEKNREEKKGEELNNKGYMGEHQDWLNGYRDGKPPNLRS